MITQLERIPFALLSICVYKGSISANFAKLSHRPDIRPRCSNGHYTLPTKEKGVMSHSYRSPIPSGPSSPPESLASTSISRRDSGSSRMDNRYDGLSVKEVEQLREHEDSLRRRGSEPSLSYIAVVSGDKSVSPFLELRYVRHADCAGHISIRLRFSYGCARI